MITRDAVLAAADHLIAAYAATDTEAYFACFSPDATFVFPTELRRLDDRAAYERLWSGWTQDGWRVESCQSTERAVQLFGSTAVFTHSVHTVTSIGGTQTPTDERESIVFARNARGALTAVHEHLSSAPSQVYPGRPPMSAITFGPGAEQ